MKIYDEITNEELTSPDLSTGYLYTSRLVIGHTEESYEIMEGTDDEHILKINYMNIMKN